MMRSLYVKILLSWMAAIVATMVLVFGLFIYVSDDGHRYYVVRSVGQTTVMVRYFLETAVTAEVKQGVNELSALRAAVSRVGATIQADVWVTGKGGKTMAASLAGVDHAPDLGKAKPASFTDAAIFVNIGPTRRTYAVIPVRLPASGGIATLHVFTRRDLGKFPHGTFVLGLALIGIAVAVMAVPLTRHITKPLKRLQSSVLRIQRGELAARADLSGEDEIGKLGAAFNDMAETVERMVRGGKELTANISHEMRSPLARIRIAGECLNEAVARGDKMDAKEMLEAMWEDIEEADRMIGRILEFSKLDLHELLPAIFPVRPAGVIEGLLKTLLPLVRSKRLAVATDLHHDIVVAGDEEWLRSAFKNLLENAVRHAPEGGTVQVVLRSEGDVALFDVTNSFPPLTTEELERIFDPFYRGSGATTEGTGLGLAITKKIVTLHHGEIGACNTPEGFKVWLRLPIFQAESPEPSV